MGLSLHVFFWVAYKQFPGIRGELQGGVLEGFDLFFGGFSVNFPDEKGKPRAVSAKIWDLSSWLYICCFS